MAVPSPRIWQQDELVKAADLNNQVRDGFRFLYANGVRPFVLLGHTGDWYSLPNNTWKSLAAESVFNIALVEFDDMWNGDGLITVNTPGLYDIRGQFFCYGGQTGSNLGTRALTIHRLHSGGGETVLCNGGAAASFCDPPQNVLGPVEGDIVHSEAMDTVCRAQIFEYLEAGDTLEMWVKQDSGSSLSVVTGGSSGNQTYFSARWVAASA